MENNPFSYGLAQSVTEAITGGRAMWFYGFYGYVGMWVCGPMVFRGAASSCSGFGFAAPFFLVRAGFFSSKVGFVFGALFASSFFRHFPLGT